MDAGNLEQVIIRMKCEKCGHNLNRSRFGDRSCQCECHNDKPKEYVPLNYHHISKLEIRKGYYRARTYKHS